VGIVGNDKIIDGSYIRNGHKLIGLASNGVHSNGFSFVRKILFEKCKYTVDTTLNDLESTLGEELLKPTTIYVPTILSLIRDLPIHGIVHVTGGGIDENIIRVIPEACKAIVRRDVWEIPPIFKIMQKEGSVSDFEMQRTFNNGIGMVIVVPDASAQEVMDRLGAMNEKAYFIGEVESRENNENQTQWV
jgi:phosphoribosylformylglycinamidine cyclo-ligase